MKNQMMIVALMFLAATVAHAEGQEGHGGDGLEINGKIYLLDLVEQGVEDAPIFDPSIPKNAALEVRLKNAIDGFTIPAELLSKKILEIRKANNLLSDLLIKAMELYAWRIVNHSLVDLPDDDGVIDPGKNLVQLAIRRGRTVRISKKYWSLLDQENQVALLIHEALYSFIAVRDDKQPSDRAREIVGYLFTKDLSREGGNGLERMLGDDIPLDSRISLSKPEGSYVVRLKGIEATFYGRSVELGAEQSPNKENLAEICTFLRDTPYWEDPVRGRLSVDQASYSTDLRFSTYKSAHGEETYLELKRYDFHSSTNLGKKLFTSKAETAECESWITKQYLLALKPYKY